LAEAEGTPQAGPESGHGRHPSSLDAPTSRRKRLVPLLGVGVIIAVLAAVFTFGMRRDPTALASAVVGRPAPEFILPTLDGSRTIRLSDLRGQVVVLNFWASWCAACKVEQQALAAAWHRYRDQGVVVLGVSFQDSPSAARDFASRYGSDWPLVRDADSSTALAYGLTGVPETFFIGPDGTVALRHAGAVTYDLLAAQIERLLPREAR
jgi:cytochrome c biogenesis protein CcmG/thiol:disulfide interchange protein DsbE